MKVNLLTTTFLIVTTALFAQESKNKVFYLDSSHKLTAEKEYKYTRVVEDYEFKKDSYIVTEYYLSGKISMTALSKNKNDLKLEGIRTDYYENGNKKQESNYTNGILIGKQFEWYENGEKKAERQIIWDAKNKSSIVKTTQFWNPDGAQTVIDGNGQYENNDEILYEKGKLKNGEKQGTWIGQDFKNKSSFTELYKNGKFRSGISTDENNNKFPYEELTEKPSPKKGVSNFYEYIGKNFILSKNDKIRGKIHLTFVVDKDGKIIDVKLIKGLRDDLDKQAIRILYKSENWIPGKIKGILTKAMYSLPITINNY